MQPPVAAPCPLSLSVWVWLHLPRAIVSGSLYGLLTRFRAITLPGVRFALVWPSAGRTVRLAGVWWGVWCGCDGPVWCFVASCVRIGERPWPWMLAGALFRVDASHACAGAMRACLASGARRVGFDVRVVGVNGGLAAREAEVRDGDSGEHVSERLCYLVVCVSVHGVGVGVHGVSCCFVRWGLFWFLM